MATFAVGSVLVRTVVLAAPPLLVTMQNRPDGLTAALLVYANALVTMFRVVQVAPSGLVATNPGFDALVNAKNSPAGLHTTAFQ